MIAHDGCFEDVSAVIDMCPLCIMLCAKCWSFEVYHLLVINLCYGVKGLLLIYCFSIKNSCHALVRTYVLQQAIWAIAFPEFWLKGASDPIIGTPFAKAGCLHFKAIDTYSYMGNQAICEPTNTEHNSSKYMKFSAYQFHIVTYHPSIKLNTGT